MKAVFAAIEPYFGAIKAMALVAIALAIFTAGWESRGWKDGKAIAELQAERAGDVARQYRAAADDLAGAARRINDAAKGAQLDVSTLATKLDAIQQDFRHAKPAPLPADCRPDAPRVRQLTAAAGAVDEAIARQRSGR